MNFRDWLDTRYHDMAAEYRRRLSLITETCREYMEGSVWEPKHTAVAIQLLQEEPIPVLGKYPGEVTAEDKSFFPTAPRPQWQSILQEYVWEVKKLENVPGESR